MNRFLPFLRLLLALTVVLRCSIADAVAISVPDPRVFARLSVAEQEVASDDLHRRMQAATPQERTQFRAALRQAIERLTPDERREIARLTRQRWEHMTPAERDRVKKKREAWAAQMTPEEREEALAQRRLLLEALSPKERHSLQQPLPSK